MGLRRHLLALTFSTALAAPALAAPLTPPNLPQATSASNPDLLLIWPCPVSCSTGGPLENVPWSVLKAQMQAQLGTSYAQVANNLSDLTNIASARSNLGLGAAATYGISFSGHNLCPLDSGPGCVWQGPQFFAASVLGSAGVNIGQGVTPTTPNNGDVWMTSAGLFTHTSGGGTLGPLIDAPHALQVGNNLSDVASASSARTNLGVAYGQAAGTVAQGNDSRFSGPTQNSQSAAYGLVLSDAGGQVYHPSSDATPRTFTIPANGSVAYAIGTKIEIVNDCSAGAITLAITTDTLEFFPSGSTGSRTIAACGTATITKVTSTKWFLVGVNVS